MLQSPSCLSALPSAMYLGSHPPARREVLLSSLERQGRRTGGTSWVLTDTLLYNPFLGHIKANLKNKVPQYSSPSHPRFSLSGDFQTLTTAMPKIPPLLPSLDPFTTRSEPPLVWQQHLSVKWLCVSSTYFLHCLPRIFIESNCMMS